jgi:hypothetical protein
VLLLPLLYDDVMFTVVDELPVNVHVAVTEPFASAGEALKGL